MVNGPGASIVGASSWTARSAAAPVRDPGTARGDREAPRFAEGGARRAEGHRVGVVDVSRIRHRHGHRDGLAGDIARRGEADLRVRRGHEAQRPRRHVRRIAQIRGDLVDAAIVGGKRHGDRRLVRLARRQRRHGLLVGEDLVSDAIHDRDLEGVRGHGSVTLRRYRDYDRRVGGEAGFGLHGELRETLLQGYRSRRPGQFRVPGRAARRGRDRPGPEGRVRGECGDHRRCRLARAGGHGQRDVLALQQRRLGSTDVIMERAGERGEADVVDLQIERDRLTAGVDVLVGGSRQRELLRGDIKPFGGRADVGAALAATQDRPPLVAHRVACGSSGCRAACRDGAVENRASAECRVSSFTSWAFGAALPDRGRKGRE
ncbi:MAG: hypothetical protein HYV63_00205 [Candidatus Schekmanbacteria bacterium]|nr:hypothetical protein [Candidatus Schekmanbacteria bacterium]